MYYKEYNRKYRIKNREKIREYNRQYRLDNPEKIKKWRQNYRRSHPIAYSSDKRSSYNKIRRWVIRLEGLVKYSKTDVPECVCCGEKEVKFLTFDHIDGNGNKHKKENNIRSMPIWLKKNNYPDGFQILCYNCNCAKGHYGVCPHQVIKFRE